MQPIILAAGKGTRMRSDRPKTLFELQGRAMIDHILSTISSVPEFEQPIIVVGHGAEEVKLHVGNSYTFSHQLELNGTAGAVKTALPFIEEGYAAVLYGDNPFLRTETLEAMIKLCKTKNPTFVQSTLLLEDFKGWRMVFSAFGRIIRNADGKLEKIVEFKSATEKERAVTEVNPGIMIAKVDWLKNAIERIKPDPVTGEYYLTGLVAIAKEDGVDIETCTIDPIEALGINSPEDAEFALGVISDTQTL